MDASRPLLGAERSDSARLSRNLSQHVLLLVESERVASTTQQQPATVFQATCCIVNVFVGLGLLSMPYALSLGGWAGLAVQALTTMLFAACGLLLVQGLAMLPAGVPQNYPMLGQYAFGGIWGRHVVMMLTTLELMGSNSMCLIIMQQQMEIFLPQNGVMGLSAKHAAMALSAVAIAPLLCMPSIRHFSGLALLGLACTASVFGTVFALPFLDPTRTYVKPKAAYHWLHIVGLLKAVGLFSCSRVIYNSFTIMFLAYGAIAAVGYWYFGDGLQPLIINNMVNGSVYNNIQLIGNLDVGRVTSLLVGLRAYTVFPAIVVVLQDIVATIGHRHGDAGHCNLRPRAALLIRLALFAILMSMAYMAYDSLARFISILGGGNALLRIAVASMMIAGIAILFAVLLANLYC